jgi:hypothetical protein
MSRAINDQRADTPTPAEPARSSEVFDFGSMGIRFTSDGRVVLDLCYVA